MNDFFQDTDQAEADFLLLQERHKRTYKNDLVLKQGKKGSVYTLSAKPDFSFRTTTVKNEDRGQALILLVEILKRKWPTKKTKPEKTIRQPRNKKLLIH